MIRLILSIRLIEIKLYPSGYISILRNIWIQIPCPVGIVIKIKLITCIGVIGYQERDGIGQDPGSEMLLSVRFDRYSISFLIDQPAGYDVLLCRPEIIRSVFIPVFVKTMCRNRSLLEIIRSCFRIKSFCCSFGTADMVIRVGTP